MALRSSTVSRARPSSVGRNWMQALTVRSSKPSTTALPEPALPTGGGAALGPISSATMTVHAPQSPSAQPSLVPVQRALSRSHCKAVVVSGAWATDTISPRCTKRIGRGGAAAGVGVMGSSIVKAWRVSRLHRIASGGVQHRGIGVTIDPR